MYKELEIREQAWRILPSELKAALAVLYPKTFVLAEKYAVEQFDYLLQLAQAATKLKHHPKNWEDVVEKRRRLLKDKSLFDTQPYVVLSLEKLYMHYLIRQNRPNEAIVLLNTLTFGKGKVPAKAVLTNEMAAHLARQGHLEMAAEVVSEQPIQEIYDYFQGMIEYFEEVEDIKSLQDVLLSATTRWQKVINEPGSEEEAFTLADIRESAEKTLVTLYTNKDLLLEARELIANMDEELKRKNQIKMVRQLLEKRKNKEAEALTDEILFQAYDTFRIKCKISDKQTGRKDKIYADLFSVNARLAKVLIDYPEQKELFERCIQGEEVMAN